MPTNCKWCEALIDQDSEYEFCGDECRHRYNNELMADAREDEAHDYNR